MNLATRENLNAQIGNLFSYFDRLEEFEQTVIDLLPHADDDQVVQARGYAKAMGKAGWRIECACDAVLLDRAALKGGRGKADTEGSGKVSAAKGRAKEIGCAPQTVRRNAQIHKVFKTVLIDQHSLLDEKGYFEAALRAPDHKKAIKLFEKEKSENPNFSVNDAKRLAKTLKDKQEKITVPDVKDYLDPHYKSFLLDLENTLLSFKNRCPRPEFEVRIDSWLRQTRFERARTPQSDFDAVRNQVDQGACTVEEIAEEVHLSEAEIEGFCVQLVGCAKPTKDADKRAADTGYEWRPIGAHTEMAKHRLYGVFRKDDPSGDSYYHPHIERGDED